MGSKPHLLHSALTHTHTYIFSYTNAHSRAAAAAAAALVTTPCPAVRAPRRRCWGAPRGRPGAGARRPALSSKPPMRGAPPRGATPRTPTQSESPRRAGARAGARGGQVGASHPARTSEGRGHKPLPLFPSSLNRSPSPPHLARAPPHPGRRQRGLRRLVRVASHRVVRVQHGGGGRPARGGQGRPRGAGLDKRPGAGGLGRAGRRRRRGPPQQAAHRPGHATIHFFNGIQQQVGAQQVSDHHGGDPQPLDGKHGGHVFFFLSVGRGAS